jgi:hypothetical protein
MCAPTRNRIFCSYLSAAGVPNELVTIKGGGHGQFTDAELENAYQKISAFLHSHGLLQ